MKFKFFNILLALSLIIGGLSCQSSDSEDTKNNPSADSLSVPQDIHSIVGIGKVEPRNGIIDLATETGGIVKAVFKESGDSMQKGDTLIILEHSSQQLKIQLLKKEIATQKQQIEANRIQASELKTRLQSKERKLAISRELAETGAETKENVSDLETEKKVLATKLSKSKKEVDLSQSTAQELVAQLATAKNELQKRTITAPQNGIILDMDVKVGSALQALTTFGTYAPEGPWIIHGEVDEMFANRLEIGQEVSIHYIGNNPIIATGKIINLSPDLSNKSLFTDEPGEKQDRRVRRFKVLLNTKDHLLINSKVECNIQIDK